MLVDLEELGSVILVIVFSEIGDTTHLKLIAFVVFENVTKWFLTLDINFIKLADKGKSALEISFK